MFLQYLAAPLLLISFLIKICMGQIVFNEDTNSLPGDSCMTPNSERGNCLRWTQCLTLSKKIKDWDRLNQYICGFEGDEPIICCPFSLQPGISDTPVDRIPPTKNNTKTTNTTSGHIPDLSIPKTNPSGSVGYRYGKPIFLPDDCGERLETLPVSFNSNRIIGGREAAKGSWPFMAVIFEVKRRGFKRPVEDSKCGGALVTASHVITAAHCTMKRNAITPLNPKQLMVRLGAFNLSIENEHGVIDVSVNAIRIHELYDFRSHTNDIAVLHLSQPVPFSNSIIPVCLPYDSLRDTDLTGRYCTVTGFGQTTANGSYSNVLMEVSFYIQDQEVCRESYERDLRITDKQLCAGTLDGSKDACVGDSGGPLVTVGREELYYLVGVVSFGKKCALSGYPGVYTRITEYLDWLTLNLAD